MNKYKRIVLHIGFWIVIVLWRSKADFYLGVDIGCFIILNILKIPPIIVSTYVLINYILPKYFFKEKNYPIFVIFFLINISMALFIERQIISSDLMSFFLPENSPAIKWFKDLHPFRNAFSLFSIMGIASLIQFYKIYLLEEKRRNELAEENLKTKLDFLKAQVNPHFLFNALNNIYSMAVQKEEKEIAAGIDNLSGIMKYLTYDSNANMVSLKKEITLIQNYIEIQQLRIAEIDDTTISFLIEGDCAHVQIAPVILLPFVENGFKHGVVLGEKSLVSIKIIIEEKLLKFRMKNTIFYGEDSDVLEGGIGLENVQNRLHLIYPGNHSLDLKNDNGYFLTKLDLVLDGE